jgi:hypothetical protein
MNSFTMLVRCDNRAWLSSEIVQKNYLTPCLHGENI